MSICSVAAFALLLLAGCGSDNGDGASDQEAPDPAAAESSEEAGTATTEPIDELDLTELVAGDGETAVADPDSPSGEPEVDAPPTQAAIEAEAFSACMRDQGIDFPDLELNEQGTVSISTLLERIDLEDRLTQSGLAQCQGELGDSFTNEVVLLLQDQTLEDSLADFSSCIREAGYDVGDLTVPSLLAGALGISGDGEASTDRMLAAGLGLNPDNPSDLAAVDGCDEIVARAVSDLGFGG